MRPHSPQPPGDEAGRGQGRLWDPTAAAHGPGFARGSPRPATQGKKKKKDKSSKEKKQIASRVSISAPWQLAQGTGLGLTAAEIWVAQRWAGHPALLAHGHFQELDFWLSQHPAAGCWRWPGAPPQGPPTVPARADLEPSSPSDLMCSCREKKKKFQFLSERFGGGTRQAAAGSGAGSEKMIWCFARPELPPCLTSADQLSCFLGKDCSQSCHSHRESRSREGQS